MNEHLGSTGPRLPPEGDEEERATSNDPSQEGAVTEESSTTRSTPRLTRTVHASPKAFFGELGLIAPDLRITTAGEAPRVLGFRDPDGEAHLYILPSQARAEIILAMVASLSDGQREAVMKTLTGGLLVASEADLRELAGKT